MKAVHQSYVSSLVGTANHSSDSVISIAPDEIPLLCDDGLVVYELGQE